VKNICERKTKI